MKLRWAVAIALAGCPSNDGGGGFVPETPTDGSTPDGLACGNTSTDPANCGWCGHSCGSASSCSNGLCAPLNLATAPTGAVAAVNLAVDGGFLYWSNTPGQCGVGGTCDGVMKCRTTGCVMSPTYVGTMAAAFHIAIAGGAIIVVTQGNTSVPLYRCSTDGCGSVPTKLADIPPAANVVADASYTAWVNGIHVRSCPNIDAACTPLTLAMPAMGQTFTAALALANGEVFYSNGATIFAAPINGGGPPRTVVSGLVSVTSLASDGVDVYYAMPAEIGKCSISGCATPTILAMPELFTPQILVDSSNVYFRTQNGAMSTIESCPKTGCVTLADRRKYAVDRIISFGIDATSVFWTNGSVRTVKK